VKLVFLLSILFVSCSSSVSKNSPKEKKQQYAFIDGSGRFTFIREHKLIKNKLISRTQITSNLGSTQKPLEKSILVSQIGSINEDSKRLMIVRPFASDFTVWLDGKRYESKMRLDTKSKTILIELESPEAKWKGRQSFPFPKGKNFCFFAQVPDCLYHNLLLSKAFDRKGQFFSFTVIWDGYPYIQDQYTGVGSKLFSVARVKYESEDKGIRKFLVEVEGQGILYHFSKSYDLVRMFWIAQGVSIIPPSEEITDVE
jgi:hypothetical protein